ncbi:MAG: MBL fold metallo-hydrolase [Spirochaetales bacterium]|nr:MAG: MBL fold metallo-hydrolase [Spirochaetales bacterium]
MIEAVVVGSMFTNAYVFTTGDLCILIDPGGDGEKLIAILDRMSLVPDAVLCTHGHLDHIAALGQAMNHFLALGKKPKVAVHELDCKYFGTQAYESHKRSFEGLGIMGEGYFESLFMPVPDPEVILRHDSLFLDSSLKILHTPGHTRGSICLYVPEEGILFSGDTLFQEGIGRTDLPDGDSASILKSIGEYILPLPPDTRIFPGHGNETTIKWEKRHNPFLY